MTLVRPTLLVLALTLLLAGCGPLAGDAKEELPPLEMAVVDRVVEDILNRLATHYDETGPQFVTDLPGMKDAAARQEGFEDWVAFKAGLNRTSLDLETRVADQITVKIRALLDRPRSD